MYSPSPGKYSFRCRSCWMRSRFTTSTVGSTSSRSCDTVDAELLELARDQRARADQRDPRAQFQERENIRARDAAEKNVADDRDMQPGDAASLFADRVEIEQALGRMFVRAVAGVDHARAERLARNCAAPAELWRRTMMSA